MVTRSDLEGLFDKLHIQEGATILLQADASALKGLVGGVTTLLESLFERIGPRGILIVPTFTLSALDPIHRHAERLSLMDMEIIRQNHPGYSSRTMPADVWPETAAAFLLHTKVKRTEHPVYSFAWYGPLPYKPALDSLDYPVSFRHILQEMKRDNAVNLLIGVDPVHSIYPMLIAHEDHLDTAEIQNAFIRRVRKTFEEPFMTSTLSKEAMLQAANKLDVQTGTIGSSPVLAISMK